MSDILIDQSTGDIAIVNCNPTLTTNTSELVAQRLQIRLNTFLEEWFYDSQVGVPYFEQVLVKPYQKSVVESVFRSVILATENVVRIIRFESEFNPQTRTYELTYGVEITNPVNDGPENRTDVPFIQGNIIDNLKSSIVLSGGDNLVYKTNNPNHSC